MTEATLRQGDRVEWNTSQGKTTGRVIRKVTRPTKVGGTELKGSTDDPVYLVESEKTGKRAGHKADALRKLA
jgi:hypothetical protein